MILRSALQNILHENDCYYLRGVLKKNNLLGNNSMHYQRNFLVQEIELRYSTCETRCHGKLKQRGDYDMVYVVVIGFYGSSCIRN